jgi:hypothetical protein
LFERVFFTRAFVCAKCGVRIRELRTLFEPTWRFVLSNSTSCIRCGSLRVRKLEYRDGIDAMSRHPFSLLFALLRAPIYHCSLCRLQYHDRRPLTPTAARVPMSVPPSTPDAATAAGKPDLPDHDAVSV